MPFDYLFSLHGLRELECFIEFYHLNMVHVTRACIILGACAIKVKSIGSNWLCVSHISLM